MTSIGPPTPSFIPSVDLYQLPKSNDPGAKTSEIQPQTSNDTIQFTFKTSLVALQNRVNSLSAVFRAHITASNISKLVATLFLGTFYKFTRYPAQGPTELAQNSSVANPILLTKEIASIEHIESMFLPNFNHSASLLSDMRQSVSSFHMPQNNITCTATLPTADGKSFFQINNTHWLVCGMLLSGLLYKVYGTRASSTHDPLRQGLSLIVPPIPPDRGKKSIEHQMQPSPSLEHTNTPMAAAHPSDNVVAGPILKAQGPAEEMSSAAVCIPTETAEASLGVVPGSCLEQSIKDYCRQVGGPLMAVECHPPPSILQYAQCYDLSGNEVSIQAATYLERYTYVCELLKEVKRTYIFPSEWLISLNQHIAIAELFAHNAPISELSPQLFDPYAPTFNSIFAVFFSNKQSNQRMDQIQWVAEAFSGTPSSEESLKDIPRSPLEDSIAPLTSETEVESLVLPQFHAEN